MNYNNLPKYLQENGKFCLWKYQTRGDSKPTKVPYQTNGKKAVPNNSETFTDFQTVLDKSNLYDGIGIGIFNQISAIDIDHCVDKNGKLSTLANEIVTSFKNCYVETSPSKTGLRIIFLTDNFSYDISKYYINNRKLGLEVYVAGATKRFVTVTGDVLYANDLTYADKQLQSILDKYMTRKTKKTSPITFECFSYLSDEDVLKKASTSSNAGKFISLWNGEIPNETSHSEADLSLSTLLAFWCGKDIEQMDRLFRQSGLMREKWDRVQSGTTYGRITLKKAVDSVTNTYKPYIVASAVDDFDTSLLQLRPFSNPNYICTDIGNSNLFADFYKNIARYVPERKQWFVFDGKCWSCDIGNLKVMKLCKTLANKLMYYALSVKDEETRKRYIDFAKKWQTRRTREVILRDAQDIHSISMGEFDKNIYLLNCQNGTLNLKSENFYPHKASDFITKLAGVNYIKSATCKRWIAFIDEVMSGDSEKADFFQKSLGYALTGDTSFESMFILFGATTRNGKGTSMETFLKICGDYGKTARPETIGMKTTSSTSPSEDVARLAGARFVNISEPDKKLTLSATLLKTLTGNDTINARFLHENSFDFKPQFKIFTNTNHLPLVTDLTLLSSGRVKIIPFERHFEEWEQDKTLKSEFSKDENLSGILNWVIDGYKKLQKTGFDIPSSVKEATLAYHKENDKVGLFIEDKLEENGSYETRTADIYYAYQIWCRENGYFPENMRNFKSALCNIGRVVRKRPIGGGEKTTLLQGYKLIETDDFLQ